MQKVKQIAAEIYRPQIGLTIWWLGNAGFVINCDDFIIFIDPVASFRMARRYKQRFIQLQDLPLKAEEMKKADLVLLTHSDDDHSDPWTLKYLEKAKPIFVIPEEIKPMLEGLDITEDTRIRRLSVKDYNTRIKFNQVNVIPIKALHHTINPCGYIIEARKGTIYLPGDTELLKEHLHLKTALNLESIDLLLLPINPTNIGLPGAAKLANALEPRYVVPMHYGMYGWHFWGPSPFDGNPNELKPLIKNPLINIIVLKPGESLELK